MKRRRHPVRDWAEYLGLRGFAGVLNCFEPEQNLQTAGAIGRIYSRLGAKRRQRAIDNIQTSFPEFSPERCAEIADKSIEHMFQLFIVDSLVMTRLITPETWPRYVSLGNVSLALRNMEPGRPALLFTGHHGNWELLGYTLAMLGLPITALARPLDNPLLNDWLLGIREARGLRILTKWGATPEMHRTLEQGGLVGFIADQNAGEGGLFVPFFNRLASSYKSIGLLALRYRTPIIAGTAIREPGTMQYTFTSPDVIRPHEWDDHPDPLYYVTARVSRAMENMVRAAPEQYLWIHRRWKSRPRHERLGRPFPASLRRKLESLPWLSADEIETIIEDSERRTREMTRASSGTIDGGRSETPGNAEAPGTSTSDASTPPAAESTA